MRISPVVAAVTMFLTSCASPGTFSPAADLAILNGQVVDGTGSPPRLQDILIKDDRIIFAGTVDKAHLHATEVLDASGKVVTPGFIDIHAHGNPLVDASFDNFLFQGATTVVLGQDGVSPQDERVDYTDHVDLAQWRRAEAGEATAFNGPVTLAQWMEAVTQHGVEVNVAPLSGHGTNRMLAGGTTERPMTLEQRLAAAEVLKADLNAGALGISSGLEYVPGRYATTEELTELAQIVGAADGVVMSHLRSEDDDKIEGAVAELITQSTNARVNFSHMKIVFGKTEDQARAVLQQLKLARSEGRRVSGDVYPYLAGFADMSLVYPEWAKREDQWNAAVKDKRPELERALFDTVMKRNGPGAILISSGKYAGQTLEEVANLLNRSFVKVLIDEFGYGGPLAAHRVMAPAVQDAFIVDPDVAISTDGGPWISHPRSWGTYPRILEEFVVNRRALSIQSAVRKMTSLPASILGLHDRGTIAVGKKADLVILDLARVVSTATWTHHNQAPTGFAAVIVNGKVAARDGKKVGRFGRVIRRAGVEP